MAPAALCSGQGAAAASRKIPGGRGCWEDGRLRVWIYGLFLPGCKDCHLLLG